MSIFIKLGIKQSYGDPDVDVNPHPGSGGVHGHQRELLINWIEEDVSWLFVVAWGTN